MASLAIVPVGLTKYRDHLPRLRTYRSDEAAEIVDYIECRQEEYLKDKGSRFVWPADEFYVTAGRDLPPRHVYEEMPQFEDGVGMGREFIAVFNRYRSRLKGTRSEKRVLFLTGCSAYPFLTREVMPYIKNELALNISLHRVSNHFWGETVTVSGLLTGKDLLGYARTKTDEYDTLVLPPNCLNNDDLFLDDLSLSQFQKALGKPVLVGSYNLAETIREAFS